eukprot:GILJ01006616.1.p1 GENE.GILJ01006616.1~~GILJ01006616.1.p1  ORF type:complete len:551 (+),score=79.29 GILJ01006616.1:357-2009(+)
MGRAISLRLDQPVEGITLTPWILLRDAEGNHHPNADAPLQFTWSRGAARVCHRTCAAPGCSKRPELQCVLCLESSVPLHQSFFCSTTCLNNNWTYHHLLHKPQIASVLSGGGRRKASAAVACVGGFGDPIECESLWKTEGLGAPGSTQEWVQITKMKSYTPTPEDVNSILKLEVLWHSDKGLLSETIETQVVLPGPPAFPDRTTIDCRTLARKPMGKPTSGGAVPRLRVLSYNVLAEIYAVQSLYSYCPLWALSWAFRSRNLLREIDTYGADLLCLQEVQADHFDDFWSPELTKRGYEGLFKQKQRESGDGKVDGCAVFFKRDKFVLLEKYAIDFNDAALARPNAKQTATQRLLKGNIAMVVVLEYVAGGGAAGSNPGQRLCVANTHIFWDPDFPDVKLWQTHTLIQELEKFVCARDLPLLLCGDFNSVPESSVYELLREGRVRDAHPELSFDPCNILPPVSKLRHSLPLQSVCSSFGEPPYTNFTGHFVGVLDYIWYTTGRLRAVQVMDVPSEERLRPLVALPSSQWSSDHAALVVDMDFLPAASAGGL